MISEGVLVHRPVMLAEVVHAMAPQPGEIIVDGTFGRGGYTRALLEAQETVKIVGIDRDPDAVCVGQVLEKEAKGRFSMVQGPFGAMDVLLAGQGHKAIHGVVLDLGVSSPQLDHAERGFSFAHDGPLDMRMSRSGPTAADVVNRETEEALANIIYTYGEERFSRRVAKKIVDMRAQRGIDRTGQLADIVRSVVPRSKDGIDPATRTFQALRLYVNDELGELERGLEAATRLLGAGGRLVVVTFHSLEDRIVKDYMRRLSGGGARGSRHVPANDRDQGAVLYTLVTRKAMAPTDEEMRNNPRSRSAKLRVALRTDQPWTALSPAQRAQTKGGL